MSRACDPSALEYRKDDQEFKVRERLKPGLCEVFSQKKQSETKQERELAVPTFKRGIQEAEAVGSL